MSIDLKILNNPVQEIMVFSISKEN